MNGETMIKAENDKVISQRENNSPSKLRSLLKLVLSYPPPRIDDIVCSSEGDIKFSISRNDIGLCYDSYCIYRSEILSDFFINFWGEILVKDHLETFAKILTDLKDYSVVNKYEHGKFGIEISGEKLIFTLHMSYIQRLLTEDFRKEIKKKAK